MKFYKDEKNVSEEKLTIYKFDKNDFTAVKGLKGSRFENKTKIVSNKVAENLIASKKAVEVKDYNIEVIKRDVQVKEIKKTK